MTVIEFEVTVDTTTPVKLSTLPEFVAATAKGQIAGGLVTKLSINNGVGNTGNAFIGTSVMTAAGLHNIPPTLSPGSGAVPGAWWTLEDQSNHNSIDLTQYYVTGSVNAEIISGVAHVN